MTFAQPGLAIAAAVCAALPFLLHLLLRRPRVTEWPSTMLLRRAIERLRRRRRIERWVLLATRSLAVLMVGWAMAGPLTRSGGVQARERWIVIDDAATGAERLADGRTSIDWLREQVRGAMRDLREGDRVALVSAASPAQVTLPSTLDLQRALREVDALQPRAVPVSWDAAIELAVPKPDERTSLPREIVLAGSFRRGSVDAEQPLSTRWKDRLVGVRRWCTAMPAGGSPNRSVVDVRAGRSAAEIAGSARVPVRVQLQRSSTGPATDAVVVKSARGEAIGRSDLTWSAAGTEARVDVSVQGGEGDAMTVQVAPDAQPLDDTVAVASVPLREPRVLVLGRRSGETDVERLPAATWVMRALESASLHPQDVDPSTVALRPAREIDAVIVTRPDLLDGAGWQWMARFTQDGGTVLLMPAPELAVQGWHAEFMRLIGRDGAWGETVQQGSFRLAARQPRTALLSLLGAEIDALAEPVTVTRRWAPPVGADTEVALSFDDGSPAMTLTRPRDGRGVVVTLATSPDLSCTDLPLKPMMVPLLQEVVRAGRWLAASAEQARSGEVASLGPAAAGGLLQPVDSGQGPAIEVDGEGRTVRAVPAPGLWKLRTRDGQERWIAVRLDVQAARIEPVEAAAFETWRAGMAPWQADGGEADGPGAQVSVSSPWAPWLLSAALALLLLEVPLARRGSPRAGSATEAVA